MLRNFDIQNAKPRDKAYKLSDGNGLALIVTPGGTKKWRLRYKRAGKENMLTLGSYPAVSLIQARKRRDDAQALLADNIDPSQQRKTDKLAAQTAAANTFGVIVKEHIETLKENGRAARTIEKSEWMLNKLAASLRDRPITEITAAELLVVLRKVEKTGRRETARRLRSKLSAVFRYAIATLRADNDPTFALRGALLQPQVQHRAAVTDEKSFGALMAAIVDYDGWPTLKAALKFQALTMTRPGDVRHMRRNEVNFVNAVWSIPAQRMKMRRPHDVPLSKQALDVLRGVWDMSQGNGYIFRSIRDAERPLSENAFNVALRRMGYSKDEATAHGFRSSASTILNARGFDPQVIEAALAHQDPNPIRRAYNRHDYWPERVKLLQEWADLIDSLAQTIGEGHTGGS